MNIMTLIDGIIQEAKDIKEKPITEEEKKKKLHDVVQDTLNILEGMLSD